MTIRPRFEIVCTMKKAISVFLMLMGLAAIVGGSFYLWGRRQWRVVVEVNAELDDEPEKINEDAFASWIIKVRMSDPKELEALLDAEAYTKLIEK